MRAFAAVPTATLVVALATTGCSNSAPSPAPSAGVRTTSSVTGAQDFDPSAFHRSTTIDNGWLPMAPGTRFTWEGHAIDDGAPVDRRVVFTVTDMTKTIQGVRTLVALDIDYNDGVLGEQELAFFAQDDGGNVWQIGQYPEVYEHGKIVEAPAWINGYKGAKAGLGMKAEPDPHAPSYAQGWGPEVGWNDRAIVYRTGDHVCVPGGCYDDVVVMREFSRTEPHASQLKYYARGVGNIRVGWMGRLEDEHEVMVLESIEQLGPEEMASLRRTVLEQEARAYRISKGVYAHTDPMEPISGA